MRRVLFPILAWFLAGCAIYLDDGWDHEELRAAIRDASAEVNLHHARLEGALDMAAARVELDRHAAASDAQLRHLRDHVDDLDCEGGGEAMMGGIMSSVWSRRASYLAEADHAGALAVLRAAADAYAADMDELMDALLERADRSDCWEW